MLQILYFLIFSLTTIILPYWDTIRKHLAEKGISPLTILHGPNLAGHFVGILALILFDKFQLPSNSTFYILWFGVTLTAAIGFSLSIKAFTISKFFEVQILNRLDFIISILLLVIFLHEPMTWLRAVGAILAFAGVICIMWPQKSQHQRIKWDIGLVYATFAATIIGFSFVLFKKATLIVPDFWAFISGRFVADLVFWTLIWLSYTLKFHKVNPIIDLTNMFRERQGKILLGILPPVLFIQSFIIYSLQGSQISIMVPLSIPAAFLFSHFKYKEDQSKQIWLGVGMIFVAILLYLK